MNIVDLFLQHAASTPDRTAILFGDSDLDYRTAREQAGRLAAWLHESGVRRGDCLLLALANSIEFSLCMLAAADLGAMLAPVSTNLPGEAMQRALQVTGSRFLIGNTAVCRRLRGVAGLTRIVVGRPLEHCLPFSEALAHETNYRLGDGEGRGDDSFLLTMTSGSTGDPKPITLTQRGKIQRSLEGARDLYHLGGGEVVITPTPMYHSLGFRLALLPLLIGGTSVLMAHFNASAWITAVKAHRVSFAIMVSSHLELILRELESNPAPLPSLRTIVSSSALLRPEVKARCVASFDCQFHECYGASEVGIVTNLSPEDGRGQLVSVGKALPYADLKILNEQHQEVPVGMVGEIACRTSTLHKGYYRQPQATADSLHDGYFLTGDMGRLDGQGYLVLSGRKKDVIIVGGSNVYPEDVEAVIKTFEGIIDCAVIGIPDAHFGEASLALVVSNGTAPDLRRLRMHCATHLAEYQQPQAYEALDALPKTALGKIRRQVLRDRYAGYDATADLRRMMGKRA